MERLSENNVIRGTLYGISVGPGDPELITLKAKRILENVPIIATPVARRDSAALAIVEQVVSLKNKQVLSLRFPMVSEEPELSDCHLALASELSAVLDSGKDIALISIGDISIYSTFGYMAELLSPSGYNIVMVPGVPSFCACAAALKQSLTCMRLPLHILPGSFLEADDLASLKGTKVIMKSGSRFLRVREAIESSGASASAVSDCGLATEKCYLQLNDIPAESSYFTTIIVGAKP